MESGGQLVLITITDRFVKLPGKSISHFITMLTRMILLGKEKHNTPTRTIKTPIVSKLKKSDAMLV